MWVGLKPSGSQQNVSRVRPAEWFLKGQDDTAKALRALAGEQERLRRDELIQAYKRAGLCAHVQQAGDTLFDVCGLPKGHPHTGVGTGHSYLDPFWDRENPLE